MHSDPDDLRASHPSDESRLPVVPLADLSDADASLTVTAGTGSESHSRIDFRDARIRRGGTGLILLCLFLFFWNLGAVPLFDLDEGIYATCAREMVLSGDWVTPRMNTRLTAEPGATRVPFYEKPILIYWLAAASMRSFGISPWSARLPVALAALLTTLLTAFVGARWFGRRAGLLAGVLYATAPITIVDARQLTTDGLLVLWFTVALLCAFEAMGAPSRSRRSRLAAVGFWIACALAVLTKGAVGLLLPVLVLGVMLMLTRLSLSLRLNRGRGPVLRFGLRLAPLHRLRRAATALSPWMGLLLLVALTAPWHLLILRAGGRDGLGHTWVQEYLIRQHIGRFKGLDTVHNAPLPSYLLFFLIGFFPWACFTPAAFRLRPEDREATGADPASPARFLTIWFWTIFLFFSAAAAKLPTYIAPAYPAAALLVGRWLDSVLAPEMVATWGRSLRRGAAAALVTALLLMVAACIGPRFAPRRAPIPGDVQQLALHLTGLLALGSGLAWACFHPGRVVLLRNRQVGVGGLALMGLLVVMVGCTEGYRVAAQEILRPYQEMAAAANTDARRGIPVVYFGIVPRRPSMNYYSTYAPFEHKEELLLPFVRAQVPAGWHQVDIVTSRDAYERLLRPELASHPELTCPLIAQRGNGRSGWVLAALKPSR